MHDKSQAAQTQVDAGTLCWCGGRLDPSVHPLYGKCRECGTLVLWRRPTDAELQEFYTLDGYWRKHQHETLGTPTIEQRANNDFRDRIPIWFKLLTEYKPRPREILDIGCGHGGFLHYCNERGITNLFGIEVDQQTCAFVRERFGLTNVFQGMFPETELPQSEFEVITGFDVLEHFTDPVAALKAAHKLLSADGLAIFQTPCYQGESRRWPFFAAPEHVHLFNDRSVRKLFEKASLEVIDVVRGRFPFDPTVMAVIARRAPVVKRLVYLRPDYVGDSVLAASTLPHLRAAYPQARIAVVCQELCKPLYEHCPHVDEIITFDRMRMYSDEAYQKEVVQRVKAFGGELCINTVYSREPLTDFLANHSAPNRIAFEGDFCNMEPAQRRNNDAQYKRLVQAGGIGANELDLLRTFLQSLGIESGQLGPLVWTSTDDAAAADEIFKSHNLSPEKTIALFAGGGHPLKDYTRWGDALAAVCNEMDLNVVALGTANQFELNQTNLSPLGRRGINLSGKTSLRESMEVIRRCRLAVGADTGTAHIACAVGTPNVIMLGGGHFGRYWPYTPLSSIVSLPIECYDCKWRCRFQRIHCVVDIASTVIEKALRETLERRSAKPRVYVQDRSLHHPAPGEPRWRGFGQLIRRDRIELIAVGRDERSDAKPTAIQTTTIALPSRHLRIVGDATRPADPRRHALAQRCLASTPQQVMQLAREVIQLGADSRRVSASPAELDVLDDIYSAVGRRHGELLPANLMAAAMLYLFPHELPPHEFDLSGLAPEMLDAFVAWQFDEPPFFHGAGESVRYLRSVQRWVARTHRSVLEEPSSAIWGQVARTFLNVQNFIPAYFNKLNLREVYSQRGDLLQHAAKSIGAPLEHQFSPVKANRRPRLGILAGHFQHSAETSAALAVYEHLGDEFDIYLYAIQSFDSPSEQYCRSRAKFFRKVEGPVSEQAAQIRADDLDILFIATNVTAVTNVPLLLGLHRLARAQCTSISAVTTSGLPNMDYYISGTLTDPAADAQDHYREKLLRMEGSVHCFARGGEEPPPKLKVQRSDWGMLPGSALFASAANFYKLIPECIETFLSILAQTEESHLLLMPFGPNWSNRYPRTEFLEHLWAMARRRGVAPARLHVLNIEPAPNRNDVKELLKSADVYLDSYPFGGSTSLMEPLEVGLPVVVRRGAQLRGAMAAGIMQELNLPELIAEDEAGFVRIAVELAQDADLRQRRRDATVSAMAAGPRFRDSRGYAVRIAPLFRSMLKS